MGEKQIFAIDIGASKVSAALAIAGKFDRFSDVFTDSAKRTLSASSHIQYTNDLSGIITRMKGNLEEKSSLKIREAFVNIDSEYINCQISRAAMALVERSLREVTFSDIKRIEGAARSLGLKMDEEVIHQFPLQFIVDSNLSTFNPIGKLARKLEVDLFLVSAKTLGIDNLAKIVSHAGLKAKRITFSGIASAAAILEKTGREKNVVVVDIGAATTKIVTFSGITPKLVNIIPFAGNNITLHLANTFKLPVDLAEELKKSYASVAVEAIDSDKDIMVKTANAYKPIKRCDLCKAVLLPAEKLIHLVKDSLNSCAEPIDKIYVCGGSALLDGFLEFMESKISPLVVLGQPNLEYFPSHKRTNFFKSPAQATLVGLLTLASNNTMFTTDSLRPKSYHIVNRVVQKARKVYYDYF